MSVATAGSKYGFETTTGLTIQQGIFESSAEQKHDIGTCMKLADGRCFFYAKAGAVALSKGLLNMQALLISGHEDCDVAVAVVAQDKEITLTPATAAVTKNQYAEGFVNVRTPADGGGEIRKIRSHPAAGIAANVVVTTYDPFTEAISVAAQADLVKNPYDEVIESAVEENLPSGVPLIDVPADYFFWNQTYGPASVLIDGAVALGANVIPGTVAGSVAQNAAALTTIPPVGVAMVAGVDTLFGAVFLKLAP